jgi:hypothetical protein
MSRKNTGLRCDELDAVKKLFEYEIEKIERARIGSDLDKMNAILYLQGIEDKIKTFSEENCKK